MPGSTGARYDHAAVPVRRNQPPQQYGVPVRARILAVLRAAPEPLTTAAVVRACGPLPMPYPDQRVRTELKLLAAAGAVVRVPPVPVGRGTGRRGPRPCRWAAAAQTNGTVWGV